MEYASIISCTKDYKRAIKIYDKLLNEQYDFKTAFERAKNYYYDQDSTKAVEELESLNNSNPDDDEVRAFLAGAYVMTNKLSSAENIYRDLERKAVDDKSKNDVFQMMLYLGDGY